MIVTDIFETAIDCQGHVGVYWRGGKLLPHIKEPGMQLKLPILDVYAPIQVTLQTDKVVDIPCGTKARPLSLHCSALHDSVPLR